MPDSMMPIRRKLMSRLLLTSGVALLISTTASFAYDLLAYRQIAARTLDTLTTIIASNSSAALAFDNPADGRNILEALRGEPHVVSAALYDTGGRLFASYVNPGAGPKERALPPSPGELGFHAGGGFLSETRPVMRGDHAFGTLYVRSDTGAVNQQLASHGLIALLVLAAASLVAYFISRSAQSEISAPILRLAEFARAVSQRRDYTVRVPSGKGLEIHQLNDAFNHMLSQIQEQHARLNAQLAKLQLLQQTTRAIGDRQDLPSLYHVLLHTLEENLPIDFACICANESGGKDLRITALGAASASLAQELNLREDCPLPVDGNGLSRCLKGELIYEPDMRTVQFPFAQRLASAGLCSLVLAPLAIESRISGVLIAARRTPGSFDSSDCEFLHQLSEHVALAAHQMQLYSALQQAYEDLRRSQHTIMQQERLRALGQMASGIAHDINNAISPVSLYTEALLEREPGLSPRARDYLTTIQRAIDDVAATVARMREFYRQRAPELLLMRIDVNVLVNQVREMTRARWNDLPQSLGINIDLRIETTPQIPPIMGAEGEIRDALTNLVFNAVDAMPHGGVLTVRTRVREPDTVVIEVQDSGVGMDAETRRRCLEPFFTTKGERGTGLGLAMVYGMIQRHSAELELDSTPGEGTTFRLLFPVATAAASSLAIIATPATTARLRILLVDDDPMLIKSLRDALEGDGHAITAANGGQAGIDTFRASIGPSGTSSFDVVITDLGMPHVDGRKVAASIHVLSPDTPVVMLTGWGHRLVAENDIPEHVSRVLNKPPRMQELRVTLAEVTAERARRAEQSPAA